MLGWQSHDGGKIGFALSGGGSRSASQVGALKALTEVGIWPDALAGTSAGAVNAAWFALHPNELEGHQALWLGLRSRDIFPGNRFRNLLNLARHGYIHGAEAWEAYVRQKFARTRFEDMHFPCSVVAVSLRSGRRVVFDSGEIAPAIMASTAIPGVFPPYRIGNELYVDGGVLEFMPIPSLLERSVTTIYALDCSAFSVNPEPQVSVVDRCARLSATRDVYQSMSLAMAHGCTVHLLRPELPEISDGRHFHRTAEFVLAGYEDARRYLEARSQLSGRPGVPQTEHPIGNVG